MGLAVCFSLYAAASLARLQPTSEMLHVGGDLFTQMPAQGGPLNPAACKRLAMTSSKLIY